MRAFLWHGAVTFGVCCLAPLGCGVVVTDPTVQRAQIGPNGGTITSIDSVLTIAIRPGALEQTVELVVQRSTEPPSIFGPAYRVDSSDDATLAIAASITYRHPIPEDTGVATIAYIDPQEYENGEGRWRPLPLIRLDPANKLVTSLDPQLSQFYGLLDSRAGLGDQPLDPSGGTTDATTTDATTTPIDPSASSSATTTGDPSSTSSDPTTPASATGPSDTGEESTTGPPGPCDQLPAGPLVAEEFMFENTPLQGNSEDMTFTSAGLIITRNGPDLVQIDPAGVVTPIPTSEPLPDTLGTRWTIGNSIVTASQTTSELLQIQMDGTVTTLWDQNLSIPNGVYAALDGNIFFTDFIEALAAYIDDAGTTLTTLGQGGDQAPQANGIIYDPDRQLVFYVTYGPGLVFRVDVSDLANPGLPDNIAAIGSLGGGDLVGLDGVAMDVCGNLYIVDQNQDAPGSLYRLNLDAAGNAVGDAQLLIEAFPDGVANVVFGQGPGWEAYETSVFTIGLPGRIFTVDVGIAGAPTPAGSAR